MKLHISISKEAEAKLLERAAAGGRSPEAVAAELVEQAVQQRSLQEVLAPVWAEFEASGMSDDELSQTLEKAKHEQRSERRSRRAS